MARIAIAVSSITDRACSAGTQSSECRVSIATEFCEVAPNVYGSVGTASYILLLARSLTWLLDFFFFNLCTRAVERASTWKYRSVNNSNLPSLSVNVHRKICMRCINFLQTKRRLLYLKFQFVLRSEHLSSRL